MSFKRTVIAAGSCVLFSCASLASQAPDLSEGTWRAVNPSDALTTIAGREPPLLPEARLKYEQNKAAARAGDRQFDTASRCLPPGMPRLLYMPGAFEFLQRREQIVILYQWNRLVRVVDMNVPQRELVGPSYLGQSVGRWEGSTLRIETIGLVDSTILDSTGLPHSEQLRLTEQYIPESANRMHVIITIDDPKMYASAWQAKLTLEHQPDGVIPEDVCLERASPRAVNW